MSNSTKVQILLRDGLICQYCGVPIVTPHVDHVLPVIKGGTNDHCNLVASCFKCNSKKSSRTWIPLNFHAITVANLDWREKVLTIYETETITRGKAHSSKSRAIHHNTNGSSPSTIGIVCESEADITSPRAQGCNRAFTHLASLSGIGRGRKPINPLEPRTTKLEMRISENEKAQLKAKLNELRNERK